MSKRKTGGETVVIWSSSDFLTSSDSGKIGGKKRRKMHQERQETPKTTTTPDDATAAALLAWRGPMTIQLKSRASVAAEKRTHTHDDGKRKSDVVAESLSMTVGNAENLVLFGDATLETYFLTPSETEALENRQRQFEKKHGEAPSVVKLHWRRRDGASLLGMRNTGQYVVESSLAEPQQCAVLGKKLWIGATSGLEKISLQNVTGKQFLCVVPQFKGVARLSVQGVGSGANALKIAK